MRVSAIIALSLLGMGLQPLAAAGDPAAPARAQIAQIQITQASDELSVGRLIARGDEMLALRDIGSARLLFEFAADQGSAEAAAKMGMTYDPLYLESLGVLGYAGDPQSALDWYTRAVDQGDRAARTRLIRLQAYVDGGPRSPAPAAGGDRTFAIQLVAMKTERTAWEEAERLQEIYGEFLGDKTLWVERLELSGGRGIMFGVRVEPFPDKLAADQLCAALHAKDQGCFVVP